MARLCLVLALVVGGCGLTPEGDVFRSAFDERALLCGACGARFSIETYLDAPLACPDCGAAFNPGCSDHHDRYFDV